MTINIGETIKIHRVVPATVPAPQRERTAPARPKRAPLPAKEPGRAPASPERVPAKR
jgi:hypothetical protein